MQPAVDIEIVGTRKTHKCKAIVDTGFTGYVTLHQDVAKTLGLEFVGVEAVMLGNGKKADAVFCDGAVTLCDETAFVPIMLNRCEKAMIGTALLANCSLSIDFQTGKTTVVRTNKRKT